MNHDAEIEVAQAPLVSVILPVRNEARHIEATLQAVLQQDYPTECLEALVVDGMSDDGTRAYVAHVAAQDPRVRLLDNPARIVPHALNAGIRAARGAVIVRVDGHTRIAPDYVRQCVTQLTHSGADNVGGRMEAEGEGLFRQAVAAATSTPFGVGGARFHYSQTEEWVDTVYLGAWPRRVFDAIGLFDEEMVRDQDDEFNYRLLKHGGRILLSPHIRSRYTVRGTPRALWRQYFQYGYWKVRVLQKHPRQMRPRQFAPPAFVGALLTTAVVGLFHRLGRYGLAALGGLYLLANLAATAWTAVRRSGRYVLLLPLVYAILHVGYGLGFLLGLIKFRKRWKRT